MNNIIRQISVADQVNEILHQRIRDGAYSPGMRLPSESELAKDFDVSRATVRTVFARMEAEGLILRKQGDGTYINEHIHDVNTHLGGLWEFSRLIESSGYEASVQPVSIVTRPADSLEQEKLKLKPGEPVVWMQRLFLADQKAVILANNTIPERKIDPAAGTLKFDLPIQEFLERYCHKRIAYVILDVSAAQIQGEAAHHLELKEGGALLNMGITFYDRDNHPLVCGQSLFNDSVLRLRLIQTWG